MPPLPAQYFSQRHFQAEDVEADLRYQKGHQDLRREQCDVGLAGLAAWVRPGWK